LSHTEKFILASQKRIRALEEPAPKFFREILEFDYEDCLVTDESQWFDFAIDAATVVARVQRVYGVNVQDVESGSIIDTLERIRLLSNRPYE
jgi:hypothetical protein